MAKNESSSESRYGPNHIDIISAYEGIVADAGSKATVAYAKGCWVYDKRTWPTSELYPFDISKKEQKLISDAVAKAENSDVIIACLGEDETIVGESFSRTSLDLPGNQRALLKALKKTGKPIVLVLINGRPLSINWANDNIPSILEAWFPGLHGGTAIADVLFGNYNPGGKMPVTTPRTVGQIPLNFPYKPASHAGQYGKGPNGFGRSRVTGVLFPFGYGLSYSTFSYSSLEIKQTGTEDNPAWEVSFDLKNTGNHDGDEIVQLYIRDLQSSVTQYVKLLRGFDRVHLKKGEKKHLKFTLKPQDLALYNDNDQWVAEKGAFRIMVGSSSEDIRLQDSFQLEKNIVVTDF
jgi:beta-glucosidase